LDGCSPTPPCGYAPLYFTALVLLAEDQVRGRRSNSAAIPAENDWRRHSLLRPLSAGPPPIPPSVLDGSVGHRVEAPGRGHPLSIKPRPMTARDAASPHNTSNRFGTSATASASTDFLQRPQRNIDRLLQL